MFRYLVLITSLVAVTYAFKDGAPSSTGVCENMTPKHGVDPQTKPSPYTVTLSKSSILPGEKVKVTLEGTDEDSFKGFLVQCRTYPGDVIVGSFPVESNDAETQALTCPGGTNNAVTHRNSKDKSKVSFYWEAPANASNLVICKATIVKNGATFWVAQPSEKLTIQQ